MPDVLVIGSGGREHAIVYSLRQSPSVGTIYCAPGNDGMKIESKVQLVDYNAKQIPELADFAAKNNIDLTVVGPDDPLVAGIANEFYGRGLRLFGPTIAAARLEGSKIFAKEFMAKRNIPTADYKTFNDEDAARKYALEELPIVIKADGLCLGKGAFVCKTSEDVNQAIDRIMVKREFGHAGDWVVVEEFLKGEEASITALTDSETVKLLASSQDHKRLKDDDEGPNTGGMGTIAPAPIITEDLEKEIMDKIMRPAVSGMAEDGREYRGCLYAGLMITDDGPQVLEFNCRFGDPETQSVLTLLETDLYEAFSACVDGNLNKVEIVNKPGAAACVVMASEGYPDKPIKGKQITFEETLPDLDVKVFHAGTKFTDNGFVTNGGRVLGVTAYGADHAEAIRKAYSGTAAIHWEGVQYRRDIGARALARRVA